MAALYGTKVNLDKLAKLNLHKVYSINLSLLIKTFFGVISNKAGATNNAYFFHFEMWF